MRRRAPIAILFVAGLAAAATPLETYTTDSVSVALPKGWKVTENVTNASFFIARQNANRDAPTMFVTVQLTGNTSNEDQLLDTAEHAASELRVTKRTAMPGGGHELLGDGLAGTIKVRIGAIAIASGGASVLGVLVAKPLDFDRLGGLALVEHTLASVKSTK